MPIAPELLAQLACPACDDRPAVELTEDQQALRCPACHRLYPIREGIPRMLPDEDAHGDS